MKYQAALVAYVAVATLSSALVIPKVGSDLVGRDSEQSFDDAPATLPEHHEGEHHRLHHEDNDEDRSESQDSELKHEHHHKHYYGDRRWHKDYYGHHRHERYREGAVEDFNDEYDHEDGDYPKHHYGDRRHHKHHHGGRRWRKHYYGHRRHEAYREGAVEDLNDEYDYDRRRYDEYELDDYRSEHHRHHRHHGHHRNFNGFRERPHYYYNDLEGERPHHGHHGDHRNVDGFRERPHHYNIDFEGNKDFEGERPHHRHHEHHDQKYSEGDGEVKSFEEEFYGLEDHEQAHQRRHYEDNEEVEPSHRLGHRHERDSTDRWQRTKRVEPLDVSSGDWAPKLSEFDSPPSPVSDKQKHARDDVGALATRAGDVLGRINEVFPPRALDGLDARNINELD